MQENWLILTKSLFKLIIDGKIVNLIIIVKTSVNKQSKVTA